MQRERGRGLDEGYIGPCHEQRRDRRERVGVELPDNRA